MLDPTAAEAAAVDVDGVGEKSGRDLVCVWDEGSLSLRPEVAEE